MSDKIRSLPITRSIPTSIELKAVGNTSTGIAQHLDIRKLIIPTLLFVVLSTSLVDQFLGEHNSAFLIIFVKTGIFLFLLIIFKLWNLA